MPLEISHRTTLRGPYLKLTLSFKKTWYLVLKGPFQSEVGTGQYNIDDLVDIRLQFEQTVPTVANIVSIIVRMSTKKPARARDSTVKLKVTSQTFNCSKQIVCTDTWTEMREVGRRECVYMARDCTYVLEDAEISFIVSKTGSVTFENLYNDSEIVDFNLSMQDSSIAVHKACLAAHSDNFRTMFSTEWKDVTDGQIQVEEASPRTLQYLKDYMYLGILPDEDLRPMLLFAIRYSMENLKSACITKLVDMVDFSSLYNLLEFACQNNIPELTFALLVQTSDEVVHCAYQIRRNALNA